MNHLLLTLLLTGPWMSLDGGARTKQLEQAHALPLQQRLLEVSHDYLGTPYAVSPLGEGEGRDADPLLRYDAVDCQTLVEQVMAQSLTKDDASLLPTLNGIRYGDGKPSFGARLHLMEAQWLPHHLEAGLLKDVTRVYGGDDTVREVKVLTKRTWLEKQAKKLDLPKEAQVTGRFPLELVPAEVAVERLRKAPAGLVVVVARAERPWLVTRVTHMGILVQTKDGPALRHASRTHQKVVDEPLARYVKRNRDYGLWTVVGFALFQVTEPQR